MGTRMGPRILFVLAFASTYTRGFQSTGIRSIQRGYAFGLIDTNTFSSSLRRKQASCLISRVSRLRAGQIERRALAVPTENDGKSLISASIFVLIDVAFRKIFTASKIAFPSSLAACSCLFLAMLALPKSAASKTFRALQPGASLLAKWLPVFFVPSLITLPLGSGLGSRTELAKVGGVVAGGFLLSLLSTAFAVTFVRGRSKASPGQVAEEAIAEAVKPAVLFTNGLGGWLLLAMAFSAVTVATDGSYRGIFLLASTLVSFVVGSRLSIKKIVHPLVTCTGLTWAAMQFMLSLGHGSSMHSWLNVYKATAGRWLLFGLGPAVVSLAVSMYERRKLMRDNLKAVATATMVSTASGLFGTALAVRSLGIASSSIRLCLLSRNITSPLAMAIASMLGADVSMAVSMVVVTGLLGANFGGSILSACGIEDGVARGLAVGSAAHGLGTAAMTQEKESFPFAAIAMALTATAATVTVSIPFFQKLLVKIALG